MGFLQCWCYLTIKAVLRWFFNDFIWKRYYLILRSVSGQNYSASRMILTTYVYTAATVLTAVKNTKIVQFHKQTVIQRHQPHPKLTIFSYVYSAVLYFWRTYLVLSTLGPSNLATVPSRWFGTQGCSFKAYVFNAVLNVLCYTGDSGAGRLHVTSGEHAECVRRGRSRAVPEDHRGCQVSPHVTQTAIPEWSTSR